MKDILNLFRRDAETGHDIAVAQLGERPDLLGGVGSGGRDRAREGMRASPPVMEKGRVGGRDDRVWGRRW